MSSSSSSNTQSKAEQSKAKHTPVREFALDVHTRHDERYAILCRNGKEITMNTQNNVIIRTKVRSKVRHSGRTRNEYKSKKEKPEELMELSMQCSALFRIPEIDVVYSGTVIGG